MKAKTIANTILRSIRSQGRGSVHTAKDFLGTSDNVSRATVDQTLGRLTKKGILNRVARGIYLYPKTSKRFGVLSPSPDAVARAAVGKDAMLQVTKARAANILGLSTQVPARNVYLTDSVAATRTIKFGRQTIVLKPASSGIMAGAGTLAGQVLQAIRNLGPDGVHDAAIRTLRSQLSPRDKRTLKRVVPKAPYWMLPVVNQVAV